MLIRGLVDIIKVWKQFSTINYQTGCNYLVITLCAHRSMSPYDFHVLCSLTFELRLFSFFGKFSDICSASESLCRMLSVSLININHHVCCCFALVSIRRFPQVACCCCPPVRKHVALNKPRPTTCVCFLGFPPLCWWTTTLTRPTELVVCPQAARQLASLHRPVVYVYVRRAQFKAQNTDRGWKKPWCSVFLSDFSCNVVGVTDTEV